MTHDDALAYAQWLSQQTGKRYRLPSEAEWEYAARAGTTTKYFFGDNRDAGCRYANVPDRRAAAEFKKQFGMMPQTPRACDDGAAFTNLVGMYEPNAFGLHDMIGNVTEWVADCEHESYAGAPADGSAWSRDCKQTEDKETMFVTRGGGYMESGNSSSRTHGGQRNPSSLGEGFRLALDGADGKPASTDSDLARDLKQAQQAARTTAGAH